MADISVALTWIAISAASVKGLAALARAVATSDSEAEPASPTLDRGPAHESPYSLERLPRSARDYR